MIVITKPMLATKCECLVALRFPVLATPKLDGIRCLMVMAVEECGTPESNRRMFTTMDELSEIRRPV
jgi:hypothetical protein